MSLRATLALALIALLSAPVRAQEEPAVVVETRPLGEVLKLVRKAAGTLALGGAPGAAAEFETQWKAALGDDLEQLKALDLTRPAGGYGLIGARMQAVVLIPVTDEKGFLTLLGKVGIEASEPKEGRYDLKAEAAAGAPPVQLKFADGYAHIGIGPTVPAAGPNPIAASKIFTAAGPAKPTLTVTLYPERIPPVFRNVVINAMQVAEESEKKKVVPDENDARRAGRMLGASLFAQTMISLLSDSDSIALSINLTQAGRAAIDLQVAPRAGTNQAELLAGWGQTKCDPVESELPGKKIVALSAGGHAMDEFRKLILQSAESSFPEGAAKEVFKLVRTQVEPVESDLSVRISRVPGQKVTAIVAATLADGAALDKSLREYARAKPDEAGSLELDVAKRGDLAVHRWKSAEEGKTPDYLAVSRSHVMLGGGSGAKDALASSKPAAAVSALVRMELWVSPLHEFELEGKSPEKVAKAKARYEAFIQSLFTEKDADRVLLTVVGGAKLQAHAEFDLRVGAFTIGMIRMSLENIFSDVSEELDKANKKEE